MQSLAKNQIFDETVTNETKVSESFTIDRSAGYSLFFKYSGASLAGTFALEESTNDGADFEPVDDSSQTIAASGGQFKFDRSGAWGTNARLTITTTNGNVLTGEAWFSAKGYE